MTNASEPVELEQEYAQMQSDLEPKALADRFIQSLATVIVVMPVLWLLGKLRKRDRDAQKK